MKELTYEQINETLYYEKLENGLDVYLLPKKGFNKTYATFTTKYGSIDNHFRIPGGDEVKVPDGIAHFLEHKMFEEEDGDVFNEFATNGASANAFTSFTRTAYLFSSTDHVKENLTTLLNFVQHAYLTDENVEKEKGIIGQEIKMYEDNPDWRAYFGLIEALYQSHPVRIDIAGTVESIAKINKETLYQCYNTFYHPSNMVLFVVGNVEPNSIMTLIKENQSKKKYDKQEPIERFFEKEPNQVKDRLKEISLTVGVSKCMIGFKDETRQLKGKELLKQELTTKLLLDILLGPSSDLYQKLYDDGLIDDSFGFDYSAESGFGFSIAGGDTKDPDQLVNAIETELKALKGSKLSSETINRCRKKKIGSFLRSLNSPEYIANSFTAYRFNESDMFEILPVLEEITEEDVNKRLTEHIDFDRFSVMIVRPQKANEQT